MVLIAATLENNIDTFSSLTQKKTLFPPPPQKSPLLIKYLSKGNGNDPNKMLIVIKFLLPAGNKIPIS